MNFKNVGILSGTNQSEGVISALEANACSGIKQTISSQLIKQELGAFEKIMTLLRDHMNDNLAVQKRLAANKDDERKQAIVKESYDKLQIKYEQFRKAKIEREDDYMKSQITSIKRIQEARENELGERRQEPVFDYDVETINFLNECNWNLGKLCDRSLAETLLGCFPSGTFLVRSSKTIQNSFALSVVANSIVRHCLIDKVGEEYCFHPPGNERQTYPSLCDLVMDYRHKKLLRHNPELDTTLIFPVLSQLKKTSKN